MDKFLSPLTFLVCVYMNSGVESMGQEIKINGGFWGRGIQTNAMCKRSSNREAYKLEARGGMDRTIAALSCAFKFLQRASWSVDC